VGIIFSWVLLGIYWVFIGSFGYLLGSLGYLGPIGSDWVRPI
jgi:hypothetical protein